MDTLDFRRASLVVCTLVLGLLSSCGVPAPVVPQVRPWNGCKKIGKVEQTNAETLNPFYKQKETSIVAINNVVFVCPCMAVGLSGAGDDSALGGAGDDSSLGGAGDDSSLGGAGDDSALGGAGDESALGGAGDDSALGGAGDDSALGGAGDDSSLGGAGDESALGGAGDDSALGGAGDDSDLGDAASPLKCQETRLTPGFYLNSRPGLIVTIFDGIRAEQFSTDELQAR